MLNDVERRTFLVEPARKDAGEVFRAAFLHIDLDEGAGQRFFFPGRGSFAGAQANDQVWRNAQRLAGLQFDIADDIVALVKDAEHRDALGHRGDARRA